MTIFRVIDTETTGFDPVQDEIVEFAFIDIDENFNVVQEVEELINPGMPIPFDAMGVHNITNQMVEGKPKIEKFQHLFKENVVYVAHNAAFDASMMGNEKQKWLCTLRLARHLVPDAPNHKLQTLRYFFDVNIGDNQAHRALDDVRMLVGVLQKLLALTDIKDADALIEFANKPIMLKKLSFGKHRGEDIQTVPADYLSWVSRQDTMDPDVRHTAKAEIQRRIEERKQR